MHFGLDSRHIPRKMGPVCPTLNPSLVTILSELHWKFYHLLSMLNDVTNPYSFAEDEVPISNLNNISKLLERQFLSRFQSHVCVSDRFSSVQSAYRCHYSPETALLQTMDSVFRSFNQGQPSLLVSLDMSAAFDTTDHSTLLNRLSVGFGVPGSVFTWFKCYLTGRYQCVRVGQASSSHTLCHTGVPQGSVLGPILFSCYISPISFIANTFGVDIQQYRYADDTQLYVSLTLTDMHARQPLLSDCLSALQLVLSQRPGSQ